MKKIIIAIVFLASTQASAQVALNSVALQMGAASDYVAYYFSDMGNITVNQMIKKGTNNAGRKILVKYKKEFYADVGYPGAVLNCTLSLRVSYDLQTVTNLNDVCD